MPDKKLTDNEIVKALEKRIKDLPCIHEKYEPACGMWCEHLHKWCIDFNNKSLKENCSEYKPCCSMSLEKQILDLINRLQAENDRLARDVFTYKIRWAKAENRETKAKAEAYKEFAERLKEEHFLADEHDIDNLLKELVGEDNESKNS